MGLIRVSKVGARGDDLLSPDLQRSAIAAMAESRGVEVSRWVEALDESGSQEGSKWWRRLDQAVQWVEDGEVDGIYVWRFSRAARHRRKWAVALDRVESSGGFLDSATEQVDVSTSTGRLARGMLAEMAAWESEVKGEQWKEVHASRLARGLPATGRARYGYVYKRGEGYDPDPVTGPIVADLYRRYVDGDTFVTLAKWLYEQGQRTTGGSVWYATHLALTMDSGFAAGVIRHGGQEYPGAHEPVIDARTWADYQRVRATNRTRSPRTLQAVHPLAGLIRCGHCGGAACRQSRRSRPAYFKCCLRGALAVGCDGPTASERRAHEAVREFLASLADDLDVRTRALAEQRAAAGQARVDGGRFEREVRRLDEALAALAVQAAQGLLPPSAHALAADDLLRARGAAEARMLAARADQAALQGSPAPQTARRIMESWDVLVEHDPKGLRDVLAQVIARVEIHKGAARLPELRVVPRWES